MRVTIFGITGYTGTNLARELVARGHEVVGVSRTPAEPGRLPEGVRTVAGSVFDDETVAEATQGADAIVTATQHHFDGPDELRDALPSLLAAAGREQARLGVVGGAGSLLTAPGGPRLLDDGFPEEWKAGAEAAARTLDALRASGTEVDWFYLSPAEVYGSFAPGERTGAYRTGDDVVVRDDEGKSFIGGEDFAAAIADELERPAHHRTRFTVAL